MGIARGAWLARGALTLAIACAVLATAPVASGVLATAPAAASVAAATPAATSVPSLPDDVAAFFAERAPEALEATELRGTAGGVHEVFAWSESYLSGAAGEPTVSLDEWIAPIERLGEPAGTITAYRPAPDEPATFAATSDDAELAAALLGVQPGARLVLDAPADAWFALVDDTVTPLDEHAVAQLPDGRATLEELQPSVVERYASMRAQPDDPSDPVGGGDAAASAQPWLLGAGIVATVIALLALLGLVVRARRRRRAT